MKDWIFLPDPVDVVPGETVLLHLVNGGLEIHELVIGDQHVQDAWEAAELATINAPPGPTPAVSVPPDVSGLRVVVASGQRVDVTWHCGRRRDRRPAPWLSHPEPLGKRHAREPPSRNLPVIRIATSG